MVIRYFIEGYEPFIQFMKTFESFGQPIVVLFRGSNIKNGISWCPNCARAQPIIEEAIKRYADPYSHFIEVTIGNRQYWRDMSCPFRTDINMKISIIPSLLKWNTYQRLEGDKCAKLELLELMFTEIE